MLGATSQPDEITLFEACSVVLDQFTFEDQELFVAIMLVRPRGEACGHAIDMEAYAERQIRLELQHRVAIRSAILINKGRERRLENIGNTTVFGVYRLHRGHSSLGLIGYAYFRRARRTCSSPILSEPVRSRQTITAGAFARGVCLLAQFGALQTYGGEGVPIIIYRLCSPLFILKKFSLIFQA